MVTSLHVLGSRAPVRPSRDRPAREGDVAYDGSPEVAHRGGGATHLRRRGGLMGRARWAGWAGIPGSSCGRRWRPSSRPARLLEGVPYMLDFLAPDGPAGFFRSPYALTGALQTVPDRGGRHRDRRPARAADELRGRAQCRLPVALLRSAPVLNVFRAVDTLVYALFFVAAVGLGPFPGVLAVVAYTATVLAKLYSEAIRGHRAADRWRRWRRRGPRGFRSCAGACCLSSCRSSCPSRCTASRRISGRRRSWASWGRAASASTSRPICACSTIRRASTVLLVLIVLVMTVDFASSRLRARLVLAERKAPGGCPWSRWISAAAATLLHQVHGGLGLLGRQRQSYQPCTPPRPHEPARWHGRSRPEERCRPARAARSHPASGARSHPASGARSHPASGARSHPASGRALSRVRGRSHPASGARSRPGYGARSSWVRGALTSVGAFMLRPARSTSRVGRCACGGAFIIRPGR